jgi:hypothetical protein
MFSSEILETERAVKAGRSWTGKRPLLVAIILLPLALAACTSTAPDRSTPMPIVESLAIESRGASDELKTRFGVPTQGKVSTDTAVAGAGAGAVAGVGWAAVCGPYFFVCAMATVPVAAAVGGAAGGIAGAASDSHKMPPEEQLLVLEKLFADIYRQRTLHMELRDSLESRIPPDRLMDASQSEALFQLKLSDIRFIRTFGGKYQWTLKSVMLVTWNRHSGRARLNYRIYDYQSTALPLGEWIQNDGELLNRALDESLEAMTEKMARDIRLKG